MFSFPQKYRIALLSPSGLCARETVAAGKEVLERCGCETLIMPHTFAGNSLPHLSAADELRAQDINTAIADENIHIIWAVRGGCGALRILDKINWQLLKESGKFFAGFSDITAIHWAMAKHGIDRYLAAPMMKFLAANTDEITAQSLFDALSGKPVQLTLPALKPGKISAPALPGNIAVAAALCGTPFFPDTAGKVLILEEVGEAPYRIERTLTQLRLSGAFDRCAGVIFGHFTSCGEMPGVMMILQDFADSVSCPVYYGLPHGHELPFTAVCGTQIISVSHQ